MKATRLITATFLALLVLAAGGCSDEPQAPEPSVAAAALANTYTVKLEIRVVPGPCGEDSLWIDFAALEINDLQGGALRASSATTSVYGPREYSATVEFGR